MSCDEFSFLKAFFIIRAKPNILLLKINVAHSINIGIISFYGEELKYHFREQRGRAEAAGAGLRGEAEFRAEAPAPCRERSCCCSQAALLCSCFPSLDAALLQVPPKWFFPLQNSDFFSTYFMLSLFFQGFFTVSACPKSGSGVIYCLCILLLEILMYDKYIQIWVSFM